MYLFLGKGISALLPKNSLVCLQISIMNHSSELGFVSSDPWKSFWMTVQICSSAWNKCHFHREPRQNFFFPWKTLWWNPCYIKSGFALRRRISVSASHNYLSVQEHIWDCFSSISKRISRKVLHSQYRGEKQRHYRKARTQDCLVCFSALYWIIAASNIVLSKFNLKKKKK